MTMKRTLLSILLIGMVMAVGCISANYTPPVHTDKKQKYVTVVNAPYDEVWSQLIQYSGKTFFAIDNFEKESGLMTLSFGASNPQRYITGGDWEYKDLRAAKQVDFKGDYVKFFSKYNNAKLNGKMNIVVTKLTENKTKLRINARYIFTQRTRRGTLTWSFDTGSYDTLRLSNLQTTAGTDNTRTICPTYKAENKILQAVTSEFEEDKQ